MDSIRQDYDGVAKFFHWTVALLIISEYLIGISLDYLPLKWLHIDIGILIVLFILLRIIWRITHKYPAMDSSLSKPNQIIAHLGHLALYGLMILITTLGLIVLFGKNVPVNVFGLTVPPLLSNAMPYDNRHMIKEIHGFLAHCIIIMAALHALAALMHQFVHKHPILVRMLPSKLANAIENKNVSK